MTSLALYLAKESGMHRLHPLTKITLLAAMFLAALLAPGLEWILGIYLLGLLPLAAWAGIFPTFLSASIKGVLPFAISLFLIQGFFGEGETVLLVLGPFSVKLEGLHTAALFSARILVALSATTLLLFTTRPDKLMLALVERGMPRQIAYIVLNTLQIIPYFQNRANMILDAQQSRGLEVGGSFIKRIRALIPLVVPLLLSSIINVDERAIALEARAFSRGGERTSLVELRDSRAQVLLRWSLLVLIVAMGVARLWLWLT